MTNDIRSTIFQLKKLGWGAGGLRQLDQLLGYTYGFYLSRSHSLDDLASIDDSIYAAYEPYVRKVFITINLANTEITNAEYDSIITLIRSVKTLDDIQEVIKIWKEEDAE